MFNILNFIWNLKECIRKYLHNKRKVRFLSLLFCIEFSKGHLTLFVLLLCFKQISFKILFFFVVIKVPKTNSI